MSKTTQTIVNPSFLAVVYEMEQLIAEGWNVSTTEAPVAGFALYEIVMERQEAAEPVKAKAGRPAKEK